MRIDAGVDATIDTEQVRLDAEIKALVGAEYFEEIVRRSGVLTDRLYGLEFIGESQIQGVGLTTAQRDALNALISKTDLSGAANLKNDPPGESTGLTPYDEYVLEKLNGTLTSAQLAIFADVRREANLHKAARKRDATK